MAMRRTNHRVWVCTSRVFASLSARSECRLVHVGDKSGFIRQDPVKNVCDMSILGMDASPLVPSFDDLLNATASGDSSHSSQGKNTIDGEHRQFGLVALGPTVVSELRLGSGRSLSLLRQRVWSARMMTMRLAMSPAFAGKWGLGGVFFIASGSGSRKAMG